MGKTAKIWLIIAASLILVGCITLGGVMTMLQWDFTKLSTSKYETNMHEISSPYRNISIVTDTADIQFVPSENTKTTVVCYEKKSETHSVTVTDGTLVIEVVDTRKWYEYIGINFASPKITVSIPQGEYGMLSVKSSTGDVEIPKDFTFESIDISESTGDVINCASALEAVKIKTSTGDIHVENVSAGALDLWVSTGDITANGIESKHDIKVKVSTGKTCLTDATCQNLISQGNTGDISLKNVIAAEKLSIVRSTGDVKFDHCDASELSITTNTGDVTGMLLSEKVFITQTNTGRVDVPKTTVGGKCEITTDTGDITITIN